MKDNEKTEIFKQLMVSYADKSKFQEMIDDVNSDEHINESLGVEEYLYDKRYNLNRDLTIEDFNELEMQKDFVDFDN